VDLAIGFEPFHVAAAVVTGGAPKSRAFLLQELAQALEIAPGAARRPGASLAAAVADADARRHLADRLPSALPDPVGSSERRFLQLYHEIDRLVEAVASRLFGVSARG
jgi:hypothetical protein